MKKILRNIYFLIINKIKLYKSIKFILLSDIIERKIKIIENESLIKIPIQKVENHINGGYIEFFYPEISIRKYQNATIFPYSDYIIFKNGAIWKKKDYVHFTKINPLDRDLIHFDENSIYVKKFKNDIIIENVFSLCGVHSNIWAHFLIQYLPKLKYLKSVIDSENLKNLTLIIPDYKDNHILDIVNRITKTYSNVTIQTLKDSHNCFCKNLFIIDNLSILSDSSSNVSLSDIIIPPVALRNLDELLINNNLFFSSSPIIKINQYKKLFISRKGLRNIINYNEILQYYINKGFEIITPHELTLEEKRLIFSQAEIIVGPGSSGFTNLIFCKPNTKVIIFSNFQRIYDLYFSIIADYLKLELKVITGKDIDRNDFNSSYYISIEKLKNL